MRAGEFYTPSEICQEYEAIAPVFIAAFAGDPWFEISKCIDLEAPQRCPNGLSAVAVGSLCEVCHNTPDKPAYTSQEVVASFENHAESYPTLWYIERVESGLALAGYASRQDHSTLLPSVYPRSVAEKSWLDGCIGQGDITWLHEIFADPSKRPSGNLNNFREMCTEFSNRFNTSMLAYCTNNPRMISAAKSAFAESVRVYQPRVDIPDHRYLVAIDLQ